MGKKTQKEERDRRESLPELLVLLKNYGKKQLNLPKHSQYQKDAEVGALWNKGERGFVRYQVWRAKGHNRKMRG